jgi:hypothetical protein
MKVKELQDFLKRYNSDAQIIIYVAHEEGYGFCPIGFGDAAIGRDEQGTVLLPADLEAVEIFPWEDDEQTSDGCKTVSKAQTTAKAETSKSPMQSETKGQKENAK